MCMKVFSLQRCYPEASGGCDQYYAEHVGEQECNKMSLPGLPYPDCRAVWAGFEPDASAVPQRHAFHARRSKGLCPACRHARQLAYLEQQAQLERRGEYSDRVQALVADLERRAQLAEGAFMARCYNGMWDAALNLAVGFGRRADAVWHGIDAALWGLFGAEGIARPEVQGLLASVWDARRDLVGYMRTTTKEMAIALVGPNMNWDEAMDQDDYAETRSTDVAQWLSRT